MTVTAIISFLKAFPEMVGLMKDLVAGVKDLQNAVTEKNIEGLKSEVNVELTRIKGAKTNKERAVIISNLSIKLGL